MDELDLLNTEFEEIYTECRKLKVV